MKYLPNLLQNTSYHKSISAVFTCKKYKDPASFIPSLLSCLDSMKEIELKYGEPPMENWSKVEKVRFILANSSGKSVLKTGIKNPVKTLKSKSILEIDYLCYLTYFELMEKLKKTIYLHRSKEIKVLP